MLKNWFYLLYRDFESKAVYSGISFRSIRGNYDQFSHSVFVMKSYHYSSVLFYVKWIKYDLTQPSFYEDEYKNVNILVSIIDNWYICMCMPFCVYMYACVYTYNHITYLHNMGHLEGSVG